MEEQLLLGASMGGEADSWEIAAINLKMNLLNLTV
jgi:hypothetical protein